MREFTTFSASSSACFGTVCARMVQVGATLVTVLLATVLLAACGSQAAPRSPDASSQIADAVADVLLVDRAGTDTAGTDASPPDVATASDTGVVLPPDAPTDTNLIVHLTGDAGVAGHLRVLLVASLADGGKGMQGDAGTLVQRDVSTWPQVVYAKAPAGTWSIAAMLTTTAGSLAQVGLACSGGLPATLTFGDGAPAVQEVDIAIHASNNGKGGGVAQFCSAAGGGPDQILTERAFVEMDGTSNGKAHYLRGITWADQLWIADSQDGVVRFDFPLSGPAPALHGWKVIGGPGCVGIARSGARVFCSTRSGPVQVVAQDTSGKLTQEQITSDSSGFEGVAIQQQTVWIAAHGNGLRAFQPTPPYAAVPLTQPGLKDAWDVAAFGSSHLIVADGANGVAILDVTNVKSPALLAELPLPGLAAYVNVHDLEVAVGAPGGGLHFLDVANPAQPKLRATAKLPDDVHGLAWQHGLWIAAAGHHTYALEMLAKGPVVRMALPVQHFAMDIVPLGQDSLLSLDFQSVRQLQVMPGAPATTLVTPPALQVPVAKVGETLGTVLPLRNPGPQPLTVQAMTFAETAGLKAAVPGGPWTVPAGGKLDVTLALAKTVKGTTTHQLLLEGAGPAPIAVRLDEVTTLQPGNTLPPLKFLDAGGQMVDVQKLLAGKPGVVLIAAQSCPAAFLAMATAAVDLGPRIAQGKAAAVALNPWDEPGRPEVALLTLPYPVLYTGLTTSDSHDWSEMVNGALGQPSSFGPPMPIVYVVDAKGTIVLAQWGYESARILETLDAL